MPSDLQRFPVIAGPTAGGKTALSVEVALRIRGGASSGAEVVSADAFQIYRGLDIGTAKPSDEERRGVPHHLIDIVEPTERFSVHQWLGLAEQTIREVRGRGAVPVVAGGSHLYVQALMKGMFEGPAGDESVRSHFRSIPAEERRRLLEEVDPDAAARIHRNDERRTVRALEVHRLTGRPISAWQREWAAAGGREDAVLICLGWPAEAINRRINARVKSMVEAGLVAEVEALWASGRLGPQAREGLGYKQLVRYFEGFCSLDEAIEQIKIETRRFAKNQRTWLRRLAAMPGAAMFEAQGADPGDLADRVLAACRAS